MAHIAIAPRSYNKLSTPFEFTISAKVLVSAKEAKWTVNRYIVSELSASMAAEPPELMIDDGKPFWRIPILLGFPFSGTIGIIGSMLVDAQTGQLCNTPENDQKIIDYATRLYEGSALQADA